ncbi:MAG: hypothetical protein WA956_06550 [Stenotrophomonas sp.]
MIARNRGLWLAAAVVTGLVAGAAWPPPPLPKLTESSDDWRLPLAVDIARHAPRDMTAVTDALRWKGDVGGTLAERGAWRLAGIVNEAGSAVLVMIPGSPDKAQRIGIGETLPDGSILLSVEGDQASTRHDTCTTTYQLFQAQAVNRSGGCEEAEVSDQGTNQ